MGTLNSRFTLWSLRTGFSGVTFGALRTSLALRPGFAGVAFRSLRTSLALNSLRTLNSRFALGTLRSGIPGIAFRAGRTLKRDRVRPVGVSSGKFQVNTSGVRIKEAEVRRFIVILRKVFPRSGGINPERRSGFAAFTLQPLRTLRSGFALGTLISLCSCLALRTLRTLRSGFALDSLRTLLTGFAGVAFFAALSLKTTRSLKRNGVRPVPMSSG